LAEFDDAVSVRLHGLILCSLAGTPCLPVVYDDKVTGTAALLGLADLAVTIAQADPELLVQRLSAARTPEVRAAVEAAAAAAHAEAERFARLIGSVVAAA
jgi:polysaccharide pyruvyl transferase WcaK-like protein